MGEFDLMLCNLSLPNYANNILMELNQLRLTDQCCDTRISTDQGFILAHKIVLCSASPYFMERLTMTSTSFDEIYLEDTSQLLVNMMVEFIYTGTLHIQKDLMESMMQLLNKIKMKDLETACVAVNQCGKSTNAQNEPVNHQSNCRSLDHELLTLQTSKSGNEISKKRPRKLKPSKMVRNYSTKENGINAFDEVHLLKNVRTNYENVCEESENKDTVPRLTISFGKKDNNTWQSEMVNTYNTPIVNDREDGNSVNEESEHGGEETNKTTDINCTSLNDVCKTKMQLKRAIKQSTETKSESKFPSVIKISSNSDTLTLNKDEIETYFIKEDFGLKDIVVVKDDTGVHVMDEHRERLIDLQSEKTLHFVNENKTNGLNVQTKPTDKSKPSHAFTKDSSKLCNVCNIDLTHLNEYHLHMKTHKHDKHVSSKDELCKHVSSIGESSKHVLSKSEDNESVSSKGESSKHVPSKRDLKQKVWPCSVCSKKLSSLVRHACHEYSKHGIPYQSRLKLHACTFEGCKYVTASKNYLQIHKRGRHGNERPHVCEYCGKGFKLPSALVTHLNIHTSTKKYKCQECDTTFNQKGGLDIHIKKHHRGQQSWSELCHLCSEKFLHKVDLCWHLYNNHGQPVPDKYHIFTCDLCDYKTIRKNKLKRHMDSHNDKRSWVCNWCGKKFVTKSYLNRHVKYHGEKTYSCVFDGCNYASVDHVGLKKHVRLMHTHKNYKPFTCTMCSYKTGLRGNLDKHIRTVHNLEVVTKHTVHLKVKFKDRRSGDIITKDGQLVQSASQRESLEYIKELQVIGDEYTNPIAEDQPCQPPVKVKQTGGKVCGKSSYKKKSEDTMFAADLLQDENDTGTLQGLETANILQTEQQQLYLQSQCLNLTNQLQLPFPVATANRMSMSNHMTVNPSDMFMNIDQLSTFKYQEFYE